MIKKVCTTGAVLAAATGLALTAAPAHADRTSGTSNSSWNSHSGFSGNQSVGDNVNVNRGCGNSNANNSSVSAAACQGSVSVSFVFS